jgi:hypothetical protein
MKYIITGETIDTRRKVTPGEFASFLLKGIILDLNSYNKLDFKKKINANGIPEKRMGVAIVHGESIKEIYRILAKVPSWFRVNWNVIPLE